MRRLMHLWSRLRSSFWFMPTLMVAGSIAFAMGLVEMDSVVSDQWLGRWPRLFGATPEGARQLLSTIAGSTMTVMGVTFSSTLVALALASSQYTSRTLSNFMRSRVTQATLGTFAGIFAYCLIVLNTVRSGEMEAAFVPNVALFFAFFLALGGVGVLIFFIHHIASSIQASSIIASVSKETLAALDRLFPAEPERRAEQDMDQAPPSLDERTWHPIPASKYGYIQGVDYGALLRLAEDNRAIVRMERGVGEFVVEGSALASLSLERLPNQQMVAIVNSFYSIGSHRMVDEDPAFGVRQIVDMALKALSPGVNDTSTAAMCVDYLTAIVARLADWNFPEVYRYEGDELRLVAKALTFEVLLTSAFDQIRRNAEGNFAIMTRMLGALAAIGSLTVRPDRRLVLRGQVERIAELADRTIDSAHDRARLEERLVRVREGLEA